MEDDVSCGGSGKIESASSNPRTPFAVSPKTFRQSWAYHHIMSRQTLPSVDDKGKLVIHSQGGESSEDQLPPFMMTQNMYRRSGETRAYEGTGTY